MTTFRYKGQTAGGAKVSGVLRAYDEFEAADKLRESVAIITKLEAVPEKKESVLSRPVAFRVKEKELALLCSQFAIILASGEAVEKYGLKPMAKLVSWGQGGVDPKIMGVGPVPASRQAMSKAGLKIGDIDLVEANEAFAAQSVAVARELGFDMSKVNVNGGAISIGHPVGASGARIIVTLLHEMQKRPEAKRGLATLCIGGGMGVATIFEKC